MSLLRRTVAGLMDAALPRSEREQIDAVMAAYRTRNIAFHALRTRQAGAQRFISVHLLVPGAWTVHDAHHIAEDFEGDIRAALGDAVVSTHVEPIEDEISMEDVHEQWPE
jgi:divalent metal cation (Fe/Co/Zn/Cd) transporter